MIMMMMNGREIIAAKIGANVCQDGTTFIRGMGMRGSEKTKHRPRPEISSVKVIISPRSWLPVWSVLFHPAVQFTRISHKNCARTCTKTIVRFSN